METGTVSKTGDLRRFIPLHDIWKTIGNDKCLCLPAVHALSGCDTVSSFYGIGKKKVWRQILKLTEGDLRKLSTFQNTEAPESVNIARNFVVKLYDSTNKMTEYHSSLNQLRFKMSVSRAVSVANLPPSEATFLQHVKRAVWQCKTWTTAHIQLPDIPAECLSTHIVSNYNFSEKIRRYIGFVYKRY